MKRISGDQMNYEWGETKGMFKTVGELSEPDMSYEFHLFWVFQHVESGRVYWASDSGCSCPSPFENEYWESPDATSFAEVTEANYVEFVKQLWGFCEKVASLQDEKREIEQKVREIVNAVQ